MNNLTFTKWASDIKGLSMEVETHLLSLSEAMVQRRKEVGRTQESIAKQLSVNQVTTRKYEKNPDVLWRMIEEDYMQVGFLRVENIVKAWGFDHDETKQFVKRLTRENIQRYLDYLEE